jgi:hypothetical protein
VYFGFAWPVGVSQAVKNSPAPDTHNGEGETEDILKDYFVHYEVIKSQEESFFLNRGCRLFARSESKEESRFA